MEGGVGKVMIRFIKEMREPHFFWKGKKKLYQMPTSKRQIVKEKDKKPTSRKKTPLI